MNLRSKAYEFCVEIINKPTNMKYYLHVLFALLLSSIRPSGLLQSHIFLSLLQCMSHIYVNNYKHGDGVKL